MIVNLASLGMTMSNEPARASKDLRIILGVCLEYWASGFSPTCNYEDFRRFSSCAQTPESFDEAISEGLKRKRLYLTDELPKSVVLRNWLIPDKGKVAGK